MISANVIDQVSLVAFWLIFMRWLTVIIQFPVFDNIGIPGLLKVLVALVLSYAFYPWISVEVFKDIRYIGLENFWILTIFYLITGLIIGFFVKSILNIFTSAGTVITQQIGFDAVRYFDLQSGQDTGPIEKLIQWTIIVMVISSGALIPMFKGVYESFFAIHIYDMGKMVHTSEFFLSFFKSAFLSALMLASPLVFINVLIASILGVISRMVPQMNIIMVGFVINIGLGLFIFAISLDEFFQVAFSIYTKKLGEWFQFVS